ncbi:hypothetical protein ACFMH7_004452 [Escherichia coli O8:H49]
MIIYRYIAPGYSYAAVSTVSTPAGIAHQHIIITREPPNTTFTAFTTKNISIIIYIDIIPGYSETTIATIPSLTTIPKRGLGKTTLSSVTTIPSLTTCYISRIIYLNITPGYSCSPSATTTTCISVNILIRSKMISSGAAPTTSPPHTTGNITRVSKCKITPGDS